MIDFPGPPLTVGQQFTVAGVIWTWDGAKWTAAGQSVAYLPLGGGTMTGPVILAADPATALGAATKQYVDASFSAQNRNRLVNGAFNVDQYNSHASVATPSGGGFFCCDRWRINSQQASKLNSASTINSGGAGLPFTYFLRVSVAATYTPAAGDVFCIYQRLMYGHTADWCWGASNVQPVTLSFLVSVGTGGGGTYSGSIRNAAGTRSYPFTFSVPDNVWTPVSITIPGDVTGTWGQSDPNVAAVDVMFDLGCGSTYRAAAGSWQAGNFIGATGARQFVTQAVNNILQFANIQLEVGSQATPFDWRPPAAELAECQRYYQTSGGAHAYIMSGNVTTGNTYYASCLFPVRMRATPNPLTLTNSAAVSFPATSGSIVNPQASGFAESRVANATAVGNFASGYVASAEI